MVTWDQVMDFARTLPGMEIGDPTPEDPRPGLRFRRATIAWARDDATMVVKIDFDDREVLLREEPETFYLTPHYRSFPGVLVRLDRVDFDQLCDLVTDAWRARATKRQLRELEQQRG